MGGVPAHPGPRAARAPHAADDERAVAHQPVRQPEYKPAGPVMKIPMREPPDSPQVSGSSGRGTLRRIQCLREASQDRRRDVQSLANAP